MGCTRVIESTPPPMAQGRESDSRKLLQRLKSALAEEGAGQERLDHVTQIIAESMETEVCSIYLFRDDETLELCATEGLNAESVHVTRMRIGEGLVGRVAARSRPVNTVDAPSEPGFRYMPETGEEIFSSFLGVPIQRLGDTLGVLVVQSKEKRAFTGDEIYGLEVVAMVIAVIKGSLVLLYFMHLRWDRPFNAIVLISSLALVALFIILALIDVGNYQPEVIPGYAPDLQPR